MRRNDGFGLRQRPVGALPMRIKKPPTSRGLLGLVGWGESNPGEKRPDFGGFREFNLAGYRQKYRHPRWNPAIDLEPTVILAVASTVHCIR